jgi:hypothetical protein
MYHFNVWTVGEAWTEFRYLDPGSAAPDCLRLRLGLYNEESGARAAIVSPNGQPLSDDFLILPLE